MTPRPTGEGRATGNVKKGRRTRALTVDLSEAEAAVRQKLPPTAVAAGQVRLSEVVQLCELASRKNARATIYRLEAAGLAKPQPASEMRRRNPHLYALDDAVNLLLACRLIETDKLTPRGATDAVNTYRHEQGQFAGTQLLETLLRVSLQRFQVHVIGRLVGALLSTLNGGAELRPGTIIFLEHTRDGEPLPEDSALLEPALRERAQRLLRKPKARSIAIVSEDQEIIFVDALAENVLHGRRFRHFPVPDGRPEHVILLAEVADDSQPRTIRRASNTDAVQLSREALAMRVLHAIGSGYDDFRTRALQELPAGVALTDKVAATLSQRDLLLWLLTCFACTVACSQWHPDVRCAIVMPQRDRSGGRVLRILAQSDCSPWSPRRPSDVALRLGQTLSGYASLTNVTLTLEETIQPLDRLVSHFVFEQEGSTDGVITAIAVPASIRGDSPSPVLYVWMPPTAHDFTTTVKALQVLAPVVGEFIQRTLDTRHTVRSSAEAAIARCLPMDEFQQALATRITALLERSGTPARVRNADERIAFVVLSAAAADSPYSHHAAQWLATQLGLLVPRSFLAPWLQAQTEDETFDDAPYGSIADAVSLLMIPRILQKGELDQLRAAIPTRVNDLPNAFTENDEQMARLNVWVVDIKVDDIGRGEDATTVVDRVLQKARAAASVLQDNIAAYQTGFVKGDWTRALRHVKNGLAKDPQNPYLLRRAAEFSICVGDVAVAEQYARQALKGQDGRVISGCLLGDARLAQGHVKDALSQYDEARALDAAHPLPHYCKGFALLSVARLLQMAADDMAWTGALGELSLDDAAAVKRRLLNVRRHCASLCSASANALRRAQGLLKHWGTSGLFPFLNFYGGPAAFGLCQTDVLQLGEAGGIQELVGARTDQPRDDLIARELLLARMCQAGVGKRLLHAYGESDTLDFLIGA